MAHRKRALVTGGNRGIGLAIVAGLKDAGMEVVLGSRDLAEGEKRAGEIGVSAVRLDVSDPGSIEEAMGRTGPFDVLVNNAGGAHGTDTVAEGKDADWEAMVQSNFLGLMRVTRACLPLMMENAGSTIINIGSIAGRVAYEGGSVYCGVKAAEKQITQSLRLELNGTGVRVGTLDPGLAETEFSMVRFKGDQSKSDKVYEGLDPLVAEDIAEAMIWMATRPPHVCIDEILIKCTAQAAVHKTHRVTN